MFSDKFYRLVIARLLASKIIKTSETDNLKNSILQKHLNIKSNSEITESCFYRVLLDVSKKLLLIQKAAFSITYSSGKANEKNHELVSLYLYSICTSEQNRVYTNRKEKAHKLQLEI